MPSQRRREGQDPGEGPGPSGRGGAGGGGGGGGAQAGVVQPVHRFALAQHLMKHGYMTEAKAKEAFERLTGSDSDSLFRRLLSDQNREMAPLNLQVRTLKYPVDEQRYVGFVNTHADAPSKLGTRYTVQEREFFRMVMETIALDEAARDGVGSASSIHLLNMEVRPPTATQQQDADAAGVSQAPAAAAAAAAVRMTKTAKEAALGKLVADGWLKHSRGSGAYCLGVRTFLELGATLLDLPDLPDDTRAAWQDLM
ncbi:hypothetical protein Rsub_03905 [Raphidocelis subcapitata]|uniref:Non-structural maintenance of chromosomes element 1 homolog n=1 Tax=Raphidocelis subcapitata TaxID=307507 RepID=A0A2V0NUN7_9CHLO|nr:hypothetical protein Rsub_03905 [Raphidocelis subcapitata]|eukprot:GBF91049.1 hypothetical protein Rsub_03905 [Raphidocelis subcapitata]